MPIPKAVARFNKHVTNPVTRRFAGRLPGFAIVTHVGRSSGRTYRTPVDVFRDGDRYVFALTYGADSDWVRNVLAAGGCTIESRGRTMALTAPERFDDSTRRAIPPPARWVLAAIGVDQFLAMREAPR
jgi:deazaflavin-dependent oxidoreductase (nitroreductase family)